LELAGREVGPLHALELLRLVGRFAVTTAFAEASGIVLVAHLDCYVANQHLFAIRVIIQIHTFAVLDGTLCLCLAGVTRRITVLQDLALPPLSLHVLLEATNGIARTQVSRVHAQFQGELVEGDIAVILVPARGIRQADEAIR
jgi:hypothetical protein